MCGHRQRQFLRARNGAKSVVSSVLRSVLTTGRLWWLSASPGHDPGCASAPAALLRPAGLWRPRRQWRPLCAGSCRKPGLQSQDRRPETGTSATGRQSTSIPSALQVRSDQPRAQPSRVAVPRRDRGRKGAVECAGRISRPMRRPKALHAAAFLINQNRRLPAHASPEKMSQGSDLLRVSIFRLKRISPHGSASRRNARSSGEQSGPASPVMNARAGMMAAWPDGRHGWQAHRSVIPGLLVPVDDALPAGGFQGAAEAGACSPVANGPTMVR